MVSRAVRRHYKAQIRQVTLLQSQWRRKLAVRELRGLRAEAKSASKFQEISYQLENKVVELTQTLQKRTAENRSLGSRVSTLEQQLATWQGKHDEVHTKSKALEAELAKPSVPISQFEEAVNARAETERKMNEAARRVAEQEKEIQRLTDELTHHASEMEEKQFALDNASTRSLEDASTITGLRNDLSSLKEQISRSNALQALTKNQREPPTSPTANGLRAFEGGAAERAPSTSRRRVRRHSTTGGPVGHARNLSDDIAALKKNGVGNRAVSAMFPQNGPPRPRDSNGLPTIGDGSSDEIVRLLEDEEGLEDDVLKGLISELKIPAASLHNPPLAKEVIFPAHLISLISNEMWKLGMISESERFLANVMQEIQRHVIVSPLTPHRTTADCTTGVQGGGCDCTGCILAIKRPRDIIIHLCSRIRRCTRYRSWLRRTERRSCTRLGRLRTISRDRQTRSRFTRIQHLSHMDARSQTQINQNGHSRTHRITIPTWIHHL
jgi:myosin-5